MAARGLLMVSMDMDPEREEAFNHWYDTKHIPDVLRAPGMISGVRYCATRGKPKYWAVYEAESEEALTQALASPEFKIAGDDFQNNWAAYASNLTRVRGVRISP